MADSIPHDAASKHGVLSSPIRPADAAADWTIPQRWDEFSAEDHWVWDTLFARQQVQLHDRAVSAFARGLDLLHLSRPGVPNFDELNERLSARTGWSVVAVPGVVPDDVFFRHLSQRRFPACNFIRDPGELDYLEEPDIFHDLFGHVPMLADPATADFMQLLGQIGVAAANPAALRRVARLYWYTVEFGLAREDGRLRIYGAGILSSFTESHYALESARPHRLAFDLQRLIRTDYVFDRLQQTYFVLGALEDLRSAVDRGDFAGLCAAIDGLPDYSAAAADPTERLAA